VAGQKGKGCTGWIVVERTKESLLAALKTTEKINYQNKI
jgi:hypothetical protein